MLTPEWFVSVDTTHVVSEIPPLCVWLKTSLFLPSWQMMCEERRVVPTSPMPPLHTQLPHKKEALVEFSRLAAAT